MLIQGTYNIFQVLHPKHPEACPTTATRLNSYVGNPQVLVTVDVPEETVTKVGGRISGRAGLGEIDTVSLHHWILW